MEWTRATASAGWAPRFGNTAVVFDNKIWVLGGIGESSPGNDVWFSTDGIHWTCATNSAAWSPRYMHTSVVFDNKIWVMGGYGGGNDVWYSSDGVNWIQATAHAGWSSRFRHTSVVFYNKIWVIGGCSGSDYKNDVWSSTDGVNWIQATSYAQWSERGDHTSVVFDDKIWVLGGEISVSPHYTNDVWYSADGVDWTCAIDSADWVKRYRHTSVIFDGKMWVLGGDAGTYKNDVWYSDSGVNWTQVLPSAGWTAREEQTSVIFDNKIWVLGGRDDVGNTNDVWYARGFIHDVSVTSIVTPSGIIDSGAVVTPRAAVKNTGAFTDTFPVIFKIGSFYADTQSVAGLAPESSVDVHFAVWTALQRGTNITRCTTALVGDSNPSNDSRTSSVTVRVRDAGVSSIIAPIGIIDSGVVIVPRSVVQNFGTVPGTFLVKFKIGTYYEESNLATLQPGQMDTLEFSSWAANQIGTFTIKCTTLLANDMNPSNDFVEDSVIVGYIGDPNIIYLRHTVDDSGSSRPNGQLDPGETGQIIVTLCNWGGSNANNVTAILRSGDSRLTVDDSFGNFGTILVDSTGNNDGDRFTVTASIMIPPETNIPCTLYITADSGYNTIRNFVIMVGGITAEDPIPDGPREPALYYAYDNVDTFYTEHPTYQWVEIKTSGTRLTMSDDQTYTITLPSAFGPWKFYNQRFTQLSICSNGWVAPGSQTATAYSNQHIPDPTITNPHGMICADWDDMVPNNSGVGGVYYYHDVANHRFIVEYDSVPYYGASSVMEKFEVVIYDTTMAARDGHNEIFVQYRTANRWNLSTVGIEAPTDNIAIQCLYNDTLHRGCAPWTPHKVIKYTTDSPTQVEITQEVNKTPTGIAIPLIAYPNPFHRDIQIKFQVSWKGYVSLAVYNISGRLIRNLLSCNLNSGNYVLIWDGRDEQDKEVTKGVYFYRFETGEKKITNKLIKLQ